MEYINYKKYLILENSIEIKQDEIKKALNLMKNYLSGEIINLYDEFKKLNIEISLEQKFPTPFSMRVIHALLKLKYGELISYSELGEMIGSKAYRAIGTILRKNALPLIIPCHRVKKKNGQIGGFMGAINNGWELNLKKKLINLELANKK